MLHSSLWLCRPAAGLAAVTAPLLAPPSKRSRSPRTWKQPDVRQLRNAPKLHRLQGILQLSQRGLPDPASQRQGHTFMADAQTSLLSRPGGRSSRLSDPRALFHCKPRSATAPRFNSGAFRKHYNSS